MRQHSILVLLFLCAALGKLRIEELPGYDQCDHLRRVCDYFLEIAPTRINPNGYPKIVYAVNGTVPGPTLYAFEGYTFRVRVFNGLEDIGITIHWHGQNQNGTAFYDGVVYVSQCPIPPQSDMVYEWKAEPAGTGWYHSHSGLQYPEGIFGPMIIYETDLARNPYWGKYDAERVILMNDWYPLGISQFYKLIDFQHQGFEGGAVSDIRFQSLLINGRGRVQPTVDFNLTCRFRILDSSFNYQEVPCNEENMPRTFVTVTKDRTYRFRIINGGSSFGLRFSIDKHEMTVIAQSQGYVRKEVVKSFVALPGERYDVIVEANQKVKNYWIRVETANGKIEYAVLHYEGASKKEPSEDIESPYSQAALLKPYFKEYDVEDECCSEGIWPQIVPCCNATMGSFHLLRLRGLEVSGGRVPQISHKQLNFTILGTMKPDYYVTINEKINVNPRVPYIFSKGKFGLPKPKHYETTGVLSALKPNWTIQAHIVHLDHLKVYDIVWLNKGPMLHPLHLHGHRFWLIGFGPNAFYKSGPEHNFSNNFMPFGTSPGDVESLNFIDPPYVDTAVVPPKGWLYLRFVADNPGPWFYHCHIETHVAAGMGVVFLESIERWPKVPSDLQRCGSFPIIPEVLDFKVEKINEGTVIASWNAPITDINEYELNWRTTGRCNRPYSEALTEETSIEIELTNNSFVDYEVRIRALNFMGGKGPWVTIIVKNGSGEAKEAEEETEELESEELESEETNDINAEKQSGSESTNKSEKPSSRRSQKNSRTSRKKSSSGASQITLTLSLLFFAFLTLF